MDSRAPRQGFQSSVWLPAGLSCLALVTMLSACGGGGGGGGGNDNKQGDGSPTSANPSPGTTTPGTTTPSTSAQAYVLTVDGGTIAASFGQGSTPGISATVRLDRAVPQAVNVAIVDTVGVLLPQVSVTPLSATSYQVDLQPAATLSAGRHTGQIEVRLCYDQPTTCAQPVAGSPWQLPYDFNVVAPPPVVTPPPVTPPAYSVVSVSHAVLMDQPDDELPLSIRVYGNLSGQPSGTVVPRFVAPTSGPFTAGPTVTTFDPTGGYQVYADMEIKATVQPGDYRGEIALQTCVDTACSSQHSAPGLIPFAVKITGTSNLTPLKVLSGATDWVTAQGNAAHTGYVPISLDASKFNQRWRRYVVTTPWASLTEVATANDKVYVGTRTQGSTNTLTAIAESDKTTAWNFVFPLSFRPSAPAVFGKLLYVASTDGYGHMEAFSQDTGTSMGFQGFFAQFDEYAAPTPYGLAVYNSAGQNGGLASFDLALTKTNWLNKTLDTGGATPAVDDKQLYLLRNGKLDIINKATGAIDAEISAGTSLSSGTPALTSQGRVVTVDYFGLSAFDPVKKTLLWLFKGPFVAQPAMANGVIYLATPTEFQARSETDGQLLWSWKPTLAQEAGDKPFDAAGLNVVVTNNVAFISSANAVYAIDLNSHASVWRHPAAGRLAISRNGVLYIAPLRGLNFAKLTAINLY